MAEKRWDDNLYWKDIESHPDAFKTTLEEKFTDILIMYNNKPIKEMTKEEKLEYDRECRRRFKMRRYNGEEKHKYEKIAKKPIKEMTIEERREYNRDRQKRFIEQHQGYRTNPETRLRKQKKAFERRQQEIREGKRKDLTKNDIPIYERCEGFDELWNMVYMQVKNYWDSIPDSRSKNNIDKPSKNK